MKIASLKDTVWLTAILLFALAFWHFRSGLIDKTVASACGMNTTIFLSPRNIGYDVVHYGQTCGMAGPSFEEIRLKSRTPPYKQKTVLRYHVAQGRAASDKDALPEVDWQSPHDVRLTIRYVTEIAHRHSRARDINILYQIRGHGAEEGIKNVLWSRLTQKLGWREIENEPNVVYIHGP